MSLSIYISGEQKKNALQKIRQLERLGHHITYNWTEDIEDIEDIGDKVAYKAAKSMDGIEKARIIIALIDDSASNTKVWFEIGVGIAHKKDVIIVGRSKGHPFYSLPQIIHKSKWSHLLEWVFTQSNIEMNRLALNLLPSSSFVERYVSIGWITDVLASGKKTAAGYKWAYSPPFSIIIINSSGYHDLEIKAIDINSRGYSLIDDTIHINIWTDSIYYLRFEYRGKYWVEVTPDLSIGVFYLRFNKEDLMTKRYGMTISHTEGYHQFL